MAAKRELKHPDKEADTGAYSAGIAIDGWVYVSGQGPVDMRSGEVVHGTIEEETRLTLSHVQKILAEAGCTLHDVVKSTVHLADIGDFAGFNATYLACYEGVDPLPARTTVESGLWGGIKVEIDVVAKQPSANHG
jgi:2-iminobutanoate/2-iminopropanoate deaminase